MIGDGSRSEEGRMFFRNSLLLMILLACGASSPAQDARQESAPVRQPGTDLHGDPLPLGASARLGTIRFRHPDFVAAIAFSPDGKVLASAGENFAAICLWDTRSGKRLRQWRGDHRNVAQLAFSPDGKILACCNLNAPEGSSDYGLVHLWDAGSGVKVRTIPGSAFAFSPRGKILAVVAPIASFTEGRWELKRQELALVELDTGKVLRRLPAVGGFRPAFSPDGCQLALVGLDAIRLVDTGTGKELRRFAFQGFRGKLALAADGKTLLAWNFKNARRGEATRARPSCDEGSVHWWTVADGQEARCLKVSADRLYIEAADFSPDGKRLLVGHYGRARLYDLAQGKELRSFPDTERGEIWEVAFSTDGARAATASKYGSIRLWEPGTGKEVRTAAEHTGFVWAVSFAPDDKTVATAAEDGAFCIWEPTGRKLRTWRVECDWRTFSPDGRFVALGAYGKPAEVWNVAHGKKVRTLQETNGYFAFSADGNRLAAIGKDDQLRCWDVDTGRLRLRIPFLRPENSAGSYLLTFSPTGKLLSGNGEKALVYHAGSAKLYTHFPTGASCDAVSFSPDGRNLAMADFKTIHLWEVLSGKERHTWTAHKTKISGLAFAPGGRLLGSCGWDREIRLWDAFTGQKIGRAAGHEWQVNCLTFSRDGKRLATGGGDATALVWDVAAMTAHPLAAQNRREKSRPTRKDLEAWWADLADQDAGRAYRAICSLVAVPDDAVKFLKDRLRPVARPDAKQIETWLKELASGQFSVRDRANRGLEKLGELAEPALKKAVAANPPLEVQRRLEKLLARLNGPVTAPEQLRVLRAVETLEYIGSDAARRLLQALADGAPGARLTREAQESLDRLHKRALRSGE
jgi:WD40 repeat protein